MTWHNPLEDDLLTRFRDFAWALPKLTQRELRQLQRELLLRLWRARLRGLQRIPAPIKLGVSYSLLAFLAIVNVPLPPEVPIFVPLLIGAAGCVALCLVAGFDLALGLVLQRLHTRVPPFDRFAEGLELE